MKCSIALIAVLACAAFPQTASAADYHVAPNGSDNNNGSRTSPWQTISKACASVPANQGHVIRLASGTYTTAGSVTVPGGASIIGADSGTTVIRGGNTPLRAANASNIVIANIKFDGGGSGTAFSGSALTNFEMHTFVIVNFDRALDFNGCSRIKIHDFRAHNASKCTSAAIEMDGSFSDAEVYNATLFNDDNVKGKMFGAVSNQRPITNLKIHDVTHFTSSVGCWVAPDGGIPPQISIELWNVSLVDCEIYNSTFNNTISIQSNGVNYAADAKTIRFHHNKWLACRGYSIEVSMHNIEIDHNFFQGGYYPIASFKNGVPGPIRNLKVHHNVFEGQRSPNLGMHIMTGVTNCEFANNTLWMNANEMVFNLSNTQDIRVRNNIFFSTAAGMNQNIPGQASNNLFHNFAAKGTAAVNGDPRFALSGDKPSAYYAIKAGGPGIDKGVAIAGITDGYTGSAPDIGASEYGAPVALNRGSRPPDAAASAWAGMEREIAGTDRNDALGRILRASPGLGSGRRDSRHEIAAACPCISFPRTPPREE